MASTSEVSTLGKYRRWPRLVLDRGGRTLLDGTILKFLYVQDQAKIFTPLAKIYFKEGKIVKAIFWETEKPVSIKPGESLPSVKKKVLAKAMEYIQEQISFWETRLNSLKGTKINGNY